MKKTAAIIICAAMFTSVILGGCNKPEPTEPAETGAETAATAETEAG